MDNTSNHLCNTKHNQLAHVAAPKHHGHHTRKTSTMRAFGLFNQRYKTRTSAEGSKILGWDYLETTKADWAHENGIGVFEHPDKTQ